MMNEGPTPIPWKSPNKIKIIANEIKLWPNAAKHIDKIAHITNPVAINRLGFALSAQALITPFPSP